jgi:hypothetical protein
MSSTWRSCLDYPLTRRVVTNQPGRAAPGGAAGNAVQPPEGGDRLAAAGGGSTACQERRRPGPCAGRRWRRSDGLGLIGALGWLLAARSRILEPCVGCHRSQPVAQPSSPTTLSARIPGLTPAATSSQRERRLARPVQAQADGGQPDLEHAHGGRCACSRYRAVTHRDACWVAAIGHAETWVAGSRHRGGH